MVSWRFAAGRVQTGSGSGIWQLTLRNVHNEPCQISLCRLCLIFHVNRVHTLWVQAIKNVHFFFRQEEVANAIGTAPKNKNPPCYHQQLGEIFGGGLPRGTNPTHTNFYCVGG